MASFRIRPTANSNISLQVIDMRVENGIRVPQVRQEVVFTPESAARVAQYLRHFSEALLTNTDTTDVANELDEEEENE